MIIEEKIKHQKNKITLLEKMYLAELYKNSALYKDVEALKKEIRRLKRLKK